MTHPVPVEFVPFLGPEEVKITPPSEVEDNPHKISLETVIKYLDCIFKYNAIADNPIRCIVTIVSDKYQLYTSGRYFFMYTVNPMDIIYHMSIPVTSEFVLKEISKYFDNGAECSLTFKLSRKPSAP